MRLLWMFAYLWLNRSALYNQQNCFLVKIAGSGILKAIASGSGHFLVVLDEKVGMELIF